MKLHPALSLFIFFAVSLTAYGQYYDTGEDPAGLKWLQIKTDRFRVIYPENTVQLDWNSPQPLRRQLLTLKISSP